MSKYDFDLIMDTGTVERLILDRIKPGSTVLEFGPAHGRMTKYMKEVKGCSVYCVELDENAARDASVYAERIYVGNIEDYLWESSFSGLLFDYIVFADVLEHLYYPQNVLLKVKSFLKDDGSILLSVPNIAHNAIIMSLFKNNFSYGSTGILDDTHIRFFTKTSLDKMLSSAGLSSVYIRGKFKDAGNTEFAQMYEDFDYNFSCLLSERPFSEVYQFVYEVKKSSFAEGASIVVDEDFSRVRDFALLCDTGNNFSGTDWKFTTGFNSGAFALQPSSDVKRFLFRPAFSACNLTLKSFVAVDSSGKDVSCRVLEHNAESVSGQHYCFKTALPKIIFECPVSTPVKVVFDVSIESLYSGASKVSLRDYEKIKNSKAFLLGKIILSPLYFFKKILKKLGLYQFLC